MYLGLFEYYNQIDRGHEIELWLKMHPEVSNYVIIDDNDMLDNQGVNFVRTANNNNNNNNNNNHGDHDYVMMMLKYTMIVNMTKKDFLCLYAQGLNLGIEKKT